MVSAWASQNRLVLGQVKVDDKSNDIIAIPRLLKVSDLNGCIITIDAMRAQKEIAQQSIAGGGIYVLGLRDNQRNAIDDVKQLFAWTCRILFENVPQEFLQVLDGGHGRIQACCNAFKFDGILQSKPHKSLVLQD